MKGIETYRGGLLGMVLLLLNGGCNIVNNFETERTVIKVSVSDAAGEPASGIGIRLQKPGWFSGGADDWVDGGVTGAAGKVTIRYKDCLGDYLAFAGHNLGFDLSKSVPCGEESEIRFRLPKVNKKPDTLLIKGVVYTERGDPEPDAEINLGRSVLVDYRDGVPVYEKEFFHNTQGDKSGAFLIKKILPNGCGWARYFIKRPDSENPAFSFYCFETEKDTLHRDINNGERRAITEFFRKKM